MRIVPHDENNGDSMVYNLGLINEIAKIVTRVLILINHTRAHTHARTCTHVTRDILIRRHVAPQFCPHHISCHVSTR